MEDINVSAEGSRKRSPLAELSCQKDSRNCGEHPQETEAKFTKWTDEKHSLYLKSMETSFVNQLYDSLDVLGWGPHAKCASVYKTSGQKHAGIPTPSGQFKVFQDGSWTRIDFRRERPRPRQAYQSGNILSNPWIQHYWSPCTRGSVVSVTNEEGVSFTCSVCKSSSSSACLHMEHQDILESNAEVTDQNFVDEVSEEEKQDRKWNVKCRKISKADDLGHDQVVPFNKSSLLGDLTQGHESFKD